MALTSGRRSATHLDRVFCRVDETVLEPSLSLAQLGRERSKRARQLLAAWLILDGKRRQARVWQHRALAIALAVIPVGGARQQRGQG